MNNNHTLKIALAFTGAVALAGCGVPMPVAYQSVPPPAMVVSAPVVSETEYIAAPSDVYIVTAVDTDVVFVGGNTYIWYVGPDGRRHRHLYCRGDHRADVFHRRDELHVVMEHHDGHLPVPGHERVMPGHIGGHPTVGPHPVPQTTGQFRAPQPVAQLHAPLPQPHPQPARHMTINSMHRSDQRS